jgi:hypothetical protein
MSVAKKENSCLDQKSCFVLSVAQIIIYSQLLNSVACHLDRQAFSPFVFSIYHFEKDIILSSKLLTVNIVKD